MEARPAVYQDAAAIADAILREVGSKIVLALPLGLGKANHIANALYLRATADSTIQLEIFTALTLEAPQAGTDLERRFLEPISKRLFSGYPDLLYAQALRKGTLPKNVKVSEFFFLAGRWLTNPRAQQNYVSANYTHVPRYLLERGVNVIAQLVAKQVVDGETRYSLSCNTDLTLDLLRARDDGNANFILVCEVNSELPFMPGEGDLAASTFSHVLDSPATDFPLFAAPKEAVNFTEYAIGLHVAGLIPDGGTLQLGIGQEADAVARSLILRQHDNAAFCEALARLSSDGHKPALPHLSPFIDGLHGLSEMLVDAFLPLIDAGILKREVDGALLHAGFFLGPAEFYRALREMPKKDLARLRMVSVSFTNQLYGDETDKRRSRVKARFINRAMMATALGAVVSDGLEDGRVVSGVGGQFNFVAQAFALNDARSVITLRATRISGTTVQSNIRWAYGQATIPRHLRDIVVTEYGVADLRGKSDEEVVHAMLGVTDSRFQSELLRQAKDSGKVARDFEIPPGQRINTPQRIVAALAPMKARGLLPPYPFGTAFTEIEQRLIPALESLKSASASQLHLLAFIMKGKFWTVLDEKNDACLERLGLKTPKTVKESAYRLLVRAALNDQIMHGV